MNLIRARLKEGIDLRYAVVLAILVILYIVTALLMGRYLGMNHDEGLSLTVFTGLALWTLGLMWISYRRWRAKNLTDAELEDIIAGINPDVVLVISPARDIVMCNNTVELMFGFTPEEVLRQKTDLLYLDRRPLDGHNHNAIHDQLESLGFHVGFATGRKRDGSHFPLEIITGAIKHRKGAVLMVRDITKRVQAEEMHREKAALLVKLEDNYRRLKESEQARENLTHMIVHDMKNPLQVILSTTQLLKEELSSSGSTETAHTYLEEAGTQTGRLIAMVNSLLDVSLLESGQVQLHTAVCDLRVSIKRAAAALSVLSAHHKIESQTTDDPVKIDCDSEMIHRVLLNLVGNAVHHTPNGTQISVKIIPGSTEARIEVTDNGPGIPDEHQHRIFEKFVRIPGAVENHAHRSTGLGLTFCKLAVEAHHGQIGVTSQPGQGTTFWFTLPNEQPPA